MPIVSAKSWRMPLNAYVSRSEQTRHFKNLKDKLQIQDYIAKYDMLQAF